MAARGPPGSAQQQQHPQGWFLGAPFTKIMSFGVGLVYAITESRKLRSSLAVDVNAALYHGQLYRFVTGTWTFASTGELVLGLIILANFSRRSEREMGSRKFCIFMTGMTVISTLLIIMASELLFDNGLQFSGPYPAIGALFGLFHRFAPRLHPRFFGVLGFHFSEKSITYLFAAQIMAYRGLASLIPSLCGFFAGWLMSVPPASKLDVPNFVASMVAAIGDRFIDDPPPPIVPRLQRGAAGSGVVIPPTMGRANIPTAMAEGPTGPLQGAGGGAGGDGWEQVLPPPPPPSDDVVNQLTSMGFERDDVLRALRASHNNVERAADRLLSGG